MSLRPASLDLRGVSIEAAAQRVALPAVADKLS